MTRVDLSALPASVLALNPHLAAARPKRPRRLVSVEETVVAVDTERVAVTLPGLRLVNPLNRRQHWRAVWQRGKRDHRAVSAALCSVDPVALPAVVTIVRVGGGTMDGDGLAASAKHVRDACARWLGCDDGDARVRWQYAQERGVFAVRVEVRTERSEGR